MKAPHESTTRVDMTKTNDSFRAAFDTVPICIVTTNPDSVITFANREAASTFGQSQEALIGQSLEQILLQLGCSADIEQFVKESAKCECHEREFTCESPVSAMRNMKITRSALAFDGHDPEHLYCIKPDHRGDMNEKRVIEMDRMLTRGEMAAEIAHEMNNFLTILIGNTELIPLFINNGDNQKAVDKLAVMKGTLGKIAHLSESLIEYGKPGTMRTINNLNDMIESTVEFFSPQNRFDGIEIRTELSENLPSFVGDCGKLQQMVGNLVHNAADELKEADGEVKTIEIKAKCSTDGEYIIISVADTGRGIDEALKSKILQRRCTTKPNGEGYGLLACKEIVDAHRGTILFDTTPGEGSCFDIWLPITVDTESDAMPQTADTNDTPD